MFTQKGAMVGIMTGAVTAGMGFNMAVPMVAYAATPTTDDAAQTALTDTQKAYLKQQLETIKDKLKALADATTDISTTHDWLTTYLNEYQTALSGYQDKIDSGDRKSAGEVKDAISTKYDNLNGQITDDTNLQANLAQPSAQTDGGLKDTVDEALQAFQDAVKAFSQIVEKNQDPMSTELSGLSWSNPMAVNTYTSTFEEDYGTYANFDFAYKRTAGQNGYIQWDMPQELADEGFTIVDTGMLAPQASIPTYGQSNGSKAPDMYVSADKKSIIIEIPDGIDGNGHANGTFSFAIHSDKKVGASGEKLDAFIVTKTENGDFSHVPQPKALNGAAAEAAKDYTKQATPGDRDAKHTFIIKFNTAGGTFIADRTVTDGNLSNIKNWAQNLPSPSKTGSRFVGWFVDEACTKVFDPFQVDLKDMTLYAKYVTTIAPESTATRPDANKKADLVHTGDEPVSFCMQRRFRFLHFRETLLLFLDSFLFRHLIPRLSPATRV